MKIAVAPLTPDRWTDLEAIFGARGCSVARGCWCMAYRLSGAREPLPAGMTRAQSNRAGLEALVDAGHPPGLIGYRGKVPVGWVSIGPREEYARLERSPVMKARRCATRLVDRLLRRACRAPRPGCGACAPRWRHCICQEEGRQAGRGLSRRPSRSFQGRFHVVRGQVHVRQGGLQGSGAAQGRAPHRPLGAFLTARVLYWARQKCLSH